jgi:lipid II:glycine glycyltransferase (peptidoglycan interpeptide bridge formation enzyme)
MFKCRNENISMKLEKLCYSFSGTFSLSTKYTMENRTSTSLSDEAKATILKSFSKKRKMCLRKIG